MSTSAAKEEDEMPRQAEHEHKFAGKDIDHLLDIINPPGRAGRYQVFVFIILCLVWSTSFLSTMTAVYFGYTPPHTCKVDNESQIPVEYDQLRAKNMPSSCSMRPANWSLDGTNGSSEVVPCQDGWTYDRSQYEDTLVTEYDLVCENQHFEVIMTIALAVSAPATLLVSYFADKYGRRRVLMISFFVDRVAGIFFSLAPNLPLVSVAMGIAALAAGEFLPMLIAFELFPSKYRGLAGTICDIIWNAVACTLPLIGYYVRSWRMLILIWNVMAAVIGVLGFWFVPESLTWLISNRRYRTAEKQLLRIARINKVEISLSGVFEEDVYLNKLGDEVKRQPSGEGKSGGDTGRRCGRCCCVRETASREDGDVVSKEKSSLGLVDLIRSARMRSITWVISGLFFVNSLVYTGLYFISPHLSGSMHMNTFLMSIVELPAYLGVVFIVHRYGRRWPIVGFQLLAGAGLIACVVELTDYGRGHNWINVATALTGKFGISGSYAVINLYGPELFPTKMRSTGVAICRVSEIIGQILVPYSSFYLVKIAAWLPPVLFGGLAILMSIPVVILPETRGRPLPETVDEIEKW